MKHLTDATIQAALDGELTPAEQENARHHLDQCPACAARAARAGRADTLLSALEPAAGEPIPARDRVLYRLRRDLTMEEKPMKKPILRPVWAVMLVIALLAAAFAFPQTRALAGQFLGLFRVQRVAVVTFDPQTFEDQGNAQMAFQAASQAFAERFTFIRETQPGQGAASLAEASALAGFEARGLADQEPATLQVEYGTAFRFTFDRDLALEALATAGLEIDLPEEIDGVEMTVDLPNSVQATYGNCRENGPSTARSDCLALIQAPSPQVDSSRPVDLAPLAAAGLRIAGWSPAAAEEFSRSVDWTTTLVIPIPNQNATYRAVEVNGSEGSYISWRDGDYAINLLVWAQDGMVFTLMGSRGEAALLMAAEGLR